jgi:hypothetical protein
MPHAVCAGGLDRRCTASMVHVPSQRPFAPAPSPKPRRPCAGGHREAYDMSPGTWLHARQTDSRPVPNVSPIVMVTVLRRARRPRQRGNKPPRVQAVIGETPRTKATQTSGKCARAAGHKATHRTRHTRRPRGPSDPRAEGQPSRLMRRQQSARARPPGRPTRLDRHFRLPPCVACRDSVMSQLAQKS